MKVEYLFSEGDFEKFTNFFMGIYIKDRTVKISLVGRGDNPLDLKVLYKSSHEVEDINCQSLSALIREFLKVFENNPALMPKFFCVINNDWRVKKSDGDSLAGDISQNVGIKAIFITDVFELLILSPLLSV